MNDRGERGAKRLDSAAPAASNSNSKQLQVHIGTQLRQLFDEVVQEPIPDRFQRLLADLDQKSAEPDGAPRS